jgi:hypothetical protein
MTNREKKIAELASNAETLVEALAKLKDRLNSFENAEKAMDSVSNELRKLIEGTAKQVSLSNKLLESASEMGIIEITRQIQGAVEQISKMEKSTTAATDTLNKLEELGAKTDTIGGGLSCEISEVLGEVNLLKSQLYEISKDLTDIPKITKGVSEISGYLQGVSKFLESNQKSLEGQKTLIETQQNMLRKQEGFRKEFEQKFLGFQKNTKLLLIALIGLSSLGILLNIFF